MAIWRWCLVAAVLGATVTAATQSSRSDARLDARALVDHVLADAVARNDIPGVVAAAGTRSRILYTGAFGVADSATGRALSTDAIFRIACTTRSSVRSLGSVADREPNARTEA
jgi:CubicO group peptidase (beta-lactamase class C family)